jgi:N-methylhydantoinase B
MDPVRTSVMNNRFTAIVEEASTILYRTAHTTFVKLVQDYQCALATADGDIFAFPTQSGVNVFIGLPLHAILEQIGKENLEPGDCIITNDPFGTDGLVTHIMDVNLFLPIFRDGKLLALAWAFVHASDVGGAVPGSISPSFTEVFQEGIRIRPVKLYRRGELNTDVLNLFLDNCRIPDEVWGDFKAMLSAMKNMERRLNQLCDRYGVADIQTGMQEVMDYADEKARSVIATIPDGTYSFADYLEGIEDGQYTYIKTTMRIAGDQAELDFTGTDPQIAAAYNFIIGERTHPYVTLALTFYILSVEPDAPKNAGLQRPIRTMAPRGTVINADFPAAMGSRAVSSTRVFDTIIGCLNQAIPGGLIAAGAGMAGIVVVNARDPLTGKNRVSVINPICGGGGGRSSIDGIEGVDGRFGSLKSVPTEAIEVETVMLMREYRLLSDTQAAGRWRGGSALVMELENTGLSATMTVRGLNRFHFRPWGVNGGDAGQVGKVIFNPGKPDERSIGKIMILELKRGDVVRMVTPAGAGFGDPLEREPERISNDVRAGLISHDKAERDYAVVFDKNGIDPRATDEKRAERRASRAPLPEFTFGPERGDYDRMWPDDVRTLLATEALRQEPGIRQPLLTAVESRLSANGKAVDRATLIAALAEEFERLTGKSLHSTDT